MKKNTQTKKQSQKNDEKNFEQFLDDLKKVTETGKKVVDIIEDVGNVKDTIEAQEVLDNKQVKAFGNYGAHILVPYKYVGKKVKIIIKKM